jgi:hypothetical protein
MILSLEAALERNRSLKDRQRSRLDFGSSRSSGSSSDSLGQLGGAFARQFSDGVAAVHPILEDILSKASSEVEQVQCVKKVLRSNSSLLVLYLSQGPTKSMEASVPAALAKLHALKHLVSKVVAIELLKETGLDSPDACVALAAAVSSVVLTGFLDGTRLTISGLFTCHNAFVKVHAPGSREFTLEDMLSDLNRFRSFITTIKKTLGLLGSTCGKSHDTSLFGYGDSRSVNHFSCPSRSRISASSKPQGVFGTIRLRG